MKEGTELNEIELFIAFVHIKKILSTLSTANGTSHRVFYVSRFTRCVSRSEKKSDPRLLAHTPIIYKNLHGREMNERSI